MTGAPDDTKVKTAFTAVDVEGAEDNKLIDDHELTSANGTLTFTLSNSKLWPVGKYKAEIYLNGTLDRTLDFEVKGSPTAQATTLPVPTVPPTQAASTLPPTQAVDTTTTARITRAFMARDENGNQVANRFKPTDTVYTIFVLEAPQGARMKAVWVAKDAQDLALNTKIDELPFDMPARVQIWVSYYPTGGDPWSPGRYQIELYVNDVLSQALDFTIEDVQIAPGAASITGGLMAFDENGDDPTTVFGQQDFFYCIISFEAPGGATIRAEWYAVDTQDYAPDSFLDSIESNVSGTDTTWFNLSPNGDWSLGSYRVDLYINDQYAITLNFEVQ